jgi:hypothetical protein
MRRIVFVLVATALAPAREPDSTSGQLETLRAAAARIEAALGKGGLTAEVAWAIDLTGFTADDLADAPAALPGLPDEVREAFGRVCLTTRYRRGPVGHLENARDTCYLLASQEPEDRLKAFRLLRREPLSEELDRAVIALGRDEAPLVRLIAAKLATSFIVFGRDAEGLHATVLGCLTDPDPNVAAACALEAPNTLDKRVIDRMVTCLTDERRLDPRAPEPMRLGEGRVSDILTRRLSWIFYSEQVARWRASPDEAEPKCVPMSADRIREWWKENREAFGFETPAPQWRCVLDKVLTVDVGKASIVEAAGGTKIRVMLKEYSEGWLEGAPVTTIEADLHAVEDAELEYMGTVGNPDHYDGFVSSTRSTWLTGMLPSEVRCSAAFLPTGTKGRVRVKLTVHFGYEPHG